jgi:aldehyde:ferredoxin oxidoreductase
LNNSSITSSSEADLNAFTGKVLWVDLTNKDWHEEALPESFYKKYLSGLGLGSALIYRDMPAGADPPGCGNYE